LVSSLSPDLSLDPGHGSYALIAASASQPHHHHGGAFIEICRVLP
jgi:hypothetical protein